MTEKIQIEPTHDSTRALREASRCSHCFDAPCAIDTPIAIRRLDRLANEQEEEMGSRAPGILGGESRWH
jgi:hypothetical protein